MSTDSCSHSICSKCLETSPYCYWDLDLNFCFNWYISSHSATNYAFDSGQCPEYLTSTQPAFTIDDQQASSIWNMDAYAFIFCGAIAFQIFVLIGMAICCYCKFKPPKENKYSFYSKIIIQ